MEETSDASWTGSIRDSVRHFVSAVSESTRQMASTAERFAAESLQLVEEATEKARHSASTSTDMARAASLAAEETRRAAISIEGAAQQALTSIQTETQKAVEALTSRSAELQEMGERLRAELELRAAETLRRLEEATAASQGLVEATERAAGQAQESASRIDATTAAAQAAGAAAEDAADQARRSATVAEEASLQILARPNAQEVLRRLEADYQLLARLAQELRELIGRMTSTAAQVAPAVAAQGGTPAPVAAAGVRGPGEATTTAPPIAVLSGEIELRVAPVADFDRLLSLDGGLGGLDVVNHVSLADFLNEEVTFRVDLAQPVGATHFARMFAEAAGVPAELTYASETKLSLRLG